MSNTNQPQNRQHFRLVFPRQGRLHLKTASGQQFPIVDISEKGLKLDFDSAQELKLHQFVGGEIRFHDGNKIKVLGKVIRKDSRGAALHLDLGVTSRDMLREQVHIMQRYPMFLEEARRQQYLVS
ncbi:PilZ domain-containing protein [Spongiibacter sp. KMU-158]|uniref:PilZ domain-containing protein n=1 Tax=Spongiibacter pelagi TaxID=2760804 RepID=A0A927C1L1_9GAMM|nr:PilZ domain-containing protein [Spongiibacter pelagi]MBD2858207.1 PilZ domain-containing protein [Spongiibacter pelagi]